MTWPVCIEVRLEPRADGAALGLVEEVLWLFFNVRIAPGITVEWV